MGHRGGAGGVPGLWVRSRIKRALRPATKSSLFFMVIIIIIYYYTPSSGLRSPLPGQPSGRRADPGARHSPVPWRRRVRLCTSPPPRAATPALCRAWPRLAFRLRPRGNETLRRQVGRVQGAQKRNRMRRACSSAPRLPGTLGARAAPGSPASPRGFREGQVLGPYPRPAESETARGAGPGHRDAGGSGARPSTAAPKASSHPSKAERCRQLGGA